MRCKMYTLADDESDCRFDSSFSSLGLPSYTVLCRSQFLPRLTICARSAFLVYGLAWPYILPEQSYCTNRMKNPVSREPNPSALLRGLNGAQ